MLSGAKKPIKLSVIMLSVILLTVIMLNVVMLNVVMLKTTDNPLKSQFGRRCLTLECFKAFKVSLL
jgi:hypothetical protein